MKNYLLIFLSCIFSYSTWSINITQGGVSLGATRVIYLSNKANMTVSVYNTAINSPMLIQSWVSDINDKTNTPFIVTPPLYRQDKGSNLLRITKLDHSLPMDRESLFYLNVKAIAATSVPYKMDVQQNQNVASKVNIALVQKIKLFYRPIALQSIAANAYQKITFRENNNKLVVDNPTPFYITLKTLNLNKRNLLSGDNSKSILPPFSKSLFNVGNDGVGNLTYTTINDFGGVTGVIEKNI